MKKRQGTQEEPPVRPELYITVILVMLMIVLAYTGQWDWVLAVFIGLLVGNGLGVWRRG